MMSFEAFRPPEEVPEIPLAGRQVGDTSLMTPDGIVHLPDCHALGQPKETKCTCGADYAHPSEFTAESGK